MLVCGALSTSGVALLPTNHKRGKPRLTTSHADPFRNLRDPPNMPGMKVADIRVRLTHALMMQTSDFQVVGGGRPDFTMLCLVPSHTASTACPWPEDYVRLLRMFSRRDSAGARALQFRLITLAQAAANRQRLESVRRRICAVLRGLCQ